jgi:DinB family protein
MPEGATLKLLREVYDGPAWHGPSVKEALDEVTASVASRRLADDRNSIWELVLHLAHGRHLLTERVTNSTSEFPRRLREAWWPLIDYEMTDAAWRDDLRLLDECHARFIEAVRRATPAQLARMPDGATHAVADQLLGMAVHDGYHAGQIRQLALQFRES